MFPCILQAIILAGFIAAPQAQKAANVVPITIAIRDSSGAVIPGAHVVFRRQPDGTPREQTTDSRGEATTDLESGSYEVVVSINGFSTKHLQTNVETSKSQTITVQLEIGPTPTCGRGPCVLSPPIIPLQSANVTSEIEPKPIHAAPVALIPVHRKNKIRNP